jgi:general secretion pathway protein D
MNEPKGGSDMKVWLGIAIGALALVGTAAEARQSAPPAQGAEQTPAQRQIAAQLAAPKLDPRATVTALDLTKTPLRDILGGIAQAAGITLRFDSAVTKALDAPATVHLSNSTAEEALHHVLDAHALAFNVIGRSTVVIYPDTPASREQYAYSVRAFTIVHADVSSLIQTVNQALTGNVDGVVLVMDREARTVYVRATPDRMAEIARLIAANDKK